MSVGYLDGAAGASGDMLLAAVLDAGWPVAALRQTLDRLPVVGWDLRVARVVKGGIAATQVHFDLPGDQPLRRLADLLTLVDAANFSDAVREPVERTLRHLAAAEALVHGVALDEVHFHEIGALDTIFDIVGVAAGLAALEVTRLVVGPVNVGGGTVRIAHGVVPVPPPAVALLAQPLITYGTPAVGELLTPTGAALLATLGEAIPAQPAMRVSAIGYGAGQKDLSHANVARLLIGAAVAESGVATVPQAAGGAPARPICETLTLLTCNLDDMNPEWFSYLPDKLFEAGALDVWLTPITMKKGRPATLVSVLAAPDRADAMRYVLYRETSTLGVRSELVQRDRLERRWEKVTTNFGPIRVKVGLLGSDVVNRAPEYEDCVAAARAANVPLKTVYAAATGALLADEGGHE